MERNEMGNLYFAKWEICILQMGNPYFAKWENPYFAKWKFAALNIEKSTALQVGIKNDFKTLFPSIQFISCHTTKRINNNN